MALTVQEEALVRQLLDEQAAILSLAGSEATILSKLGATKVTLSDLTAVSTVADADLLLMRQGTTDKSLSALILGAYAANAVPLATEIVAGKGELATNAEAQAFTANKIIDGAKLNTALKGSNQSLITNGYQKMPGGLILQWGSVSSALFDNSSPITFTLPITFPTACLQAFLSSTSGLIQNISGAGEGAKINTISASSVIFRVDWSVGLLESPETYRIFAIGH